MLAGLVGYYKKVPLLYDWSEWEGDVSRKNQGNKKREKENQTSPSRIRLWFDRNINILQGIGVLLLVTGILGGGAWWVVFVNSRLDQIQASVNKFENKLDDGLTRISKVEVTLGVLERHLFPKAFELGFTDPQFVPLKLVNSSQMHIAESASDGVAYNFTFTVKEVGKDHIILLVDGDVKPRAGKSGAIIVRNSLVGISTRVGEPVNLWQVLKNFAMFPEDFDVPPLWLAIIDFPVPDTAIVAVGTRKI